MGPRHSKRSLDMAGTPTKSEIEGVGNAGKLEKIVDGIVEKAATNGHVEGELQNGAEPLQNGIEAVHNGEAPVVTSEHPFEKVKLNEKDRDEAIIGVNGETEEKTNGETDEKVDSDGKEEKKDKKKEKKEKVVKKKFSFRSFSFSKKDKSKPKEERIGDMKNNTGIEESSDLLTETVEQKVSAEEPKIVESEKKVENCANVVEETNKENVVFPPSTVLVLTVDASVTETAIPEATGVESANKESSADDLPPPLPASPPPSDVKDDIATEQNEDIKENGESSPSPKDTESTITIETEERANQVQPTAENIEEKATDLLQVVEEKIEESNSIGTEIAAEANCDMKDEVEISESSASDDVVEIKDEAPAVGLNEEASKPDESVVKTISSIITLSSNPDEASDKQEEFGAGESLAEMDGGPEATPNANEVAVLE